MQIFLQEYLWTLAILFIFGFSGFFTLVPFRQTIKYSLLAAPLAGLLTLTFGTILIYDIVHLKLFSSVLIAAAIFSSISVISLFMKPLQISRQELGLGIFVLLASGFIVYLVNYASIHFGGPGFSYLAGTDHLGYVQTADWLRHHSIFERPPLSPLFPEYSWTNFVFSDNPRFGSYFCLALISALHGGAGMFSYDFATGVILCAGCMGVSAVVAKNRATYILLFLGLLFGMWFGYSRAGYLGKILAYPALIYAAGIFFTAQRPISIFMLASLSLYFCVIGALFPGVNIGLLFLALGSLYIILRLFYHQLNPALDNLKTIGADAIGILILAGITIATSGVISLPASWAVVPMDSAMPILAFLSYLFEINNRVPAKLGSTAASYLALFSSLIIIFCVIALRKRVAYTATFFLFPLSLIAVFTTILLTKGDLTVQWVAYELVGLYYPLLLCGIIQVIDSWSLGINKNEFKYYMAIGGCILILWSQAHKFWDDVLHFSGRKVNPILQFSKSQLDELAKVIDHQPVIVNGKGMDANRALPLLIYLKTMIPQLQWSAEGWRVIVGYRTWSPPKTDPARLYIELLDQPAKKNCAVKFKTQQYRLVKC